MYSPHPSRQTPSQAQGTALFIAFPLSLDPLGKAQSGLSQPLHPEPRAEERLLMNQPAAAPPTIPSARHALPLLMPPFLAPKRQGETSRAGKRTMNILWEPEAPANLCRVTGRAEQAGERGQALRCQCCRCHGGGSSGRELTPSLPPCLLPLSFLFLLLFSSFPSFSFSFIFPLFPPLSLPLPFFPSFLPLLINSFLFLIPLCFHLFLQAIVFFSQLCAKSCAGRWGHS